VADAAAESLARYGPSVIDDLVPLLSPLDAPTRRPAITTLACLGTSAVPRLIELLAHEDRSVAVSASVALNRMRRTAVPALAEAVSTGNEQVVEHAADALGSIGPVAKTALPILLEAAGSERRSDLSRLATARAALKVDASASRKSAAIPSIVPMLIRIFEKGTVEHQRSAAELLGEIGAPAQTALPALRKRLLLPDKSADAGVLIPAYEVQQKAKEAIVAIEADLAADAIETSH
jgi:HEAT repeat protein